MRPHALALTALAALASLLASAPASAPESDVVYDDFATATLDPARWTSIHRATRKWRRTP